ncbi:MAG: pyridoxal-phosphate dependent enzyme [Crocinitomicaceae bacterium]|nr:pyridoxal-phosphate dependent enzyme [Crocinitomicaceae bacterium]MDG1776806.1 pyridoxal-phosphate dependent enzyme [Crocinitomicaceae bacterium]
MIDVSKSKVECIDLLCSKERGLKVFVKRDDLIHEEVSGNKWRKLKYNIELCYSRKNEGVLTFGGAFSNHLVATASACKQVGIKAIGFVRGEELSFTSNSTLQRCHDLGMQLVFISRETYRIKNEKAYRESLSLDYPNFHIVEEGGANYYGMIGCQEIMTEVDESIDHVFVSQGTSTTSCGVLLSLNLNQQLHVVPALKGYDSLEEMKVLIGRSRIEQGWADSLMNQVEVLDQYHFGGYGKYTVELLDFISGFYEGIGLKLDPVYTGKAMFGMVNELKKSSYDNSNVLFIHTGGLQGVEGIEKKSGFKFF